MLSHALDYDVSIESCIVFPAHFKQRHNCDVALRATALPRLSMSDKGIRFWTNLHWHWKLIGCAWMLMLQIINIYKPPPTRLQSLDLSMFPHPCLYACDFNCQHVDWGYNDNIPEGECLAGWASNNSLFLLFNAKDAASFYSSH